MCLVGEKKAKALLGDVSQDKLADSFLAIPSKKKRKESKTKAVQHFVLQL